MALVHFPPVWGLGFGAFGFWPPLQNFPLLKSNLAMPNYAR